MKNLISLHNLEFGYQSSKPLLIIPHWELKSGEKIFLAGPSGSGKTTFLEILSGILEPQKGEYLFDGKNLVGMSSGQRDQIRKHHMSLIFQNFNLIPYLNVEENILLPYWLGYSDGRKHDELKSKAHELLTRLGLGGHARSSVTQLSHGQQQRVAAVRTLLKRPRLILADEPTSALDSDARESFLKLLLEMATECQAALIFVSHDRSFENLFQRTCHLRDWTSP